jgi:hypothetical protein
VPVIRHKKRRRRSKTRSGGAEKFWLFLGDRQYR